MIQHAQISQYDLKQNLVTFISISDEREYRGRLPAAGRGDPGQEPRAGDQASPLPPAPAGRRAQVPRLQSVENISMS